MPFFPGDLDLWPSNSSERGTKHVFRVNLVQIRSAVPDIFHTQTKIQTGGAKNRTFRSWLRAEITCCALKHSCVSLYYWFPTFLQSLQILLTKAVIFLVAFVLTFNVLIITMPQYSHYFNRREPSWLNINCRALKDVTRLFVIRHSANMTQWMSDKVNTSYGHYYEIDDDLFTISYSVDLKPKST